MKINREKLFELYMAEVNEIAEKCDWKSTFGPEEIVGMISTIIENHPEVYETLQKKTANPNRGCHCRNRRPGRNG